MPRPDSSTTIQRPDLGAIAYEYALEASHRGFIAEAIMPTFDVAEQSADYPVIPIEAMLKMPPSIRRKPRGGYQRGDYEFEDGTYSCKEYGWEEPLDDTERALYARFFDAEEVATMRAVDIVLRHREKRTADKVFNTSNLSSGAVSTEWSTAATCTPKADVKDAKSTLRAATGIEPNAMAISKKVFDNLLICKEVKDYLQYTNPHLMATRELQRAILAQYLDLDDLFVGNAIYDAAKKGKSKSLTDIWDDEYALLFKTPNNAMNLREPILGRTFRWTADSPALLSVETYRQEEIRSDIYRVREQTDEAFVFTGAGYLLSNITA